VSANKSLKVYLKNTPGWLLGSKIH